MITKHKNKESSIVVNHKITNIISREILDSRGNPTLETTVFAGKNFATASIPSGASTGAHEALELRDGDSRRYGGLGVKTAINNVTKKILPLVKGFDVFNQEALDVAMIERDGTPSKAKLGANAILSVSLANSRLAAHLSGKELYLYLAKQYKYTVAAMPTPLCNVINGGVHADSGLDIQEFFLIPRKGSFAQKVERTHTVIRQLQKNLIKGGYSVGVGDEGGFAPKLGSNDKALRELAIATEGAGFTLGKDFSLGFDAAATEFYDASKDVYRFQADHKHYKPASITRLYEQWVKHYHVAVIEDGCAEDDFTGWQHLTNSLGKKVALVGDDLFVTNSQRIQTGIIAGIANAVLIKVNQIGTLTETIDAIKLAQKYGYKIVISHRSGETTDTFIADLSAAVNAEYIKAGSLNRGERLAKYNRLLEIEYQVKG